MTRVSASVQIPTASFTLSRRTFALKECKKEKKNTSDEQKLLDESTENIKVFFF